MQKINLFFILIFAFFFAFSCKEKENVHREKDNFGSVILQFTHTVDKQPIQLNQLIYTNATGNQYQVNEVKYFISKVFLVDDMGKSFEIKQDNGIHYVDFGLENTKHWKIDNIPFNTYTSVSFVFGLDEKDNQSNRFVNPPECNFSWPDNLGGGYHYMQINGKFLNKENQIQNMNIHTGIGTTYNENNEIVFIHNYFSISLPVVFSVNEETATSLNLNMEIQRWFDTPNPYDFNEFGTGIMQNQQAQNLLRENGRNVFDVKMR
jgi:hypothetical protein